MYGVYNASSKYDYDELAYEPPAADEKLGASYYTAAPPCRAVLHAASVKDKKPGLLSAAKGLLKR